MKNELLTRAYIVAGALALAAMLVFGQTFRIAIQEGDRWRSKGDSLLIRYVPIEAPRGNILAADGSLLASSQPFYELRMDTRASGITDEIFESNVDSLAKLIHKKINSSRSADSTAKWLRAARANKDRYLLIHKSADFPTYDMVKSWPILNRGPNRGGFIAIRNEARRRPFGMMAQRTIGYKRADGSSVGLEDRYDDVLGGEAGRRPMLRLPGNHLLPLEDLQHASPKSGNDVQTNIDVTIQDVVQQELEAAILKHQAEYGVAIVLETKTGAVRAMTSLTRHSDNSVSEIFNHAVATAVEPGSTFKLASVLALLDDKKAKLEDTIRVFNGNYTFYDKVMVDASKHGLDTITLGTAFEISSNVGIARFVTDRFGNNLKGRKQFVNKLRQFRLDRTTGIDITGEKLPWIKDPEHDTLNVWSGITLPWMSMGYELELTPLQMVSFYNAVANDGRYMKPQLASNIQREGKIIEEFSPVVLENHIASAKAIAFAKEVLLGVVENGTASRYRTSLYKFAGKTGTVQYNYSKKAVNEGRNGHQASFIGYFPAENPRYTMMVLISKPEIGGYYGSDVALPVWRKISDKLFAADPNLHEPIYAHSKVEWQQSTLPRNAVGSHADISAIFDELDINAFDKARRGMVKLISPGDTLSVVTHLVPDDKVPDVRGMGARDAMFLLEKIGCRVDLRGRGQVKTQSIKPGTTAKGQYVKLILG